MRVVELPFRVMAPMLACGADMKGAFALARGDKAYLLEGFGSLDDPDSLDAYEKSIASYERKLKIKPAAVIYDLHPGYFSGRFATKHADELGAKICAVQHHESHAASAITEHSLRSAVIGVAFDGTGYGPDGCVWGGEFFLGSAKEFRRAARFNYVAMPGGELAIRQPWRMVVSYLYNVLGAKLFTVKIDAIKNISINQRRTLKKMLDEGINSPLTSSAGRLFDAASSLILCRSKASYEAELPIALEKIVDASCKESYKYHVEYRNKMLIIDTSLVIKGILSDIKKRIDAGIMSAKFHNTMAGIIAEVAIRLRRKAPHINKVVLSGGVFQNIYLKRKAHSLLNTNGFDVYTQSEINTNDYGIPIGQLAIANARKLCV